MKMFLRWFSAPYRNYTNRHFAALHDHLSRVDLGLVPVREGLVRLDSRLDDRVSRQTQRELTELREVNQALLDSIHVLTESVSKLRDEVHAASRGANESLR
jgi:hypothetical protein